MKAHPLPPLNTLGFILADPATALPLLEGERVVVFSTEVAAQRYRERYPFADVRAARVIAVAMVPLMSGVEASQAAVVTSLRRRRPRRKPPVIVLGLEDVAEARKRQRRTLAP